MSNSLVQDISFGIRILLKKPGFTVAAVLTSALGIGATTVIFCLVYSILLRPLPFQETDELVMLWESNLQKAQLQTPVSPPNFLDWREHNKVFEGLAAHSFGSYTITGFDEPEIIPGSRVSANLFDLIGVSPVLGRTFTTDDEQPGRNQVVLLSYELWRRRFGLDSDIIGKTITLDNKSYFINGVMPPGFHFPEGLAPAGSKTTGRADIWLPLSFNPAQLRARAGRSLGVIGRLKLGVTLAQAQAEMSSIVSELEQQYPDNAGYSINIVPIREQVVGTIKPALVIFFGAVGFVLLIACVNIANLLLARSTSRQKEFAIRMAVGSSRYRLIQQLLVESMLLAFTGGIAGVLLAYGGVRFIVASMGESLPRSGEIKVDLPVLGFTLLVSALTGIVFGFVPALQASKADFNESLKESSRSSTDPLGRNRLRRFFVVSEIAFALILLIGAGLMLKSFYRLITINPGFKPENVITLRIALPGTKYSENHQQVEFFNQIVDRIKNLPGVKSVGMTNNLPLTGMDMRFTFSIEGRQSMPGEDRSIQYHTVSPDYFHTLGIQLLEGRDFTEQDNQDAPGAVIINKTLARRFFLAETPLGQRLKIPYSKINIRQIIGVVEDVKHSNLDANSQAEVYVPYAQDPWPFMTLVIGTNSVSSSSAAILKNKVWELDKDLPIESIRTMEQILSDTVSRPRFYARLLGIFAVLAIILAAVGIYGVISYSVTQRTHEIGIRMALGAQQGDVLRLIVGQGMLLAFAGVAIGLVGAFSMTRVLSGLLYNVSPDDFATFALTSILLMSVALVASYIPARRAARLDPMIALRYE